MQVIGFNLEKISAEKKPSFKQMGNINTNVEFLSLDKEKIDIIKDKEVIKIGFNFSVDYSSVKLSGGKKKFNPDEIEAEIIFEGSVLLAAEKEESKEIFKSWKKKELPSSIRIPLFNLILKKCNTKSLQLEEDINLPVHISMPRVQAQDKDN